MRRVAVSGLDSSSIADSNNSSIAAAAAAATMPSVRKLAFEEEGKDDEDDNLSGSQASGISDSVGSANKRRRVADSNSNPQLLHAPGAIVRVVMTDFVTYAHAEFTLGPSLNMLIGPNGTGKSTLVCAVALGLGGKPEVSSFSV